jgi:hypothetical protein
VTLDGVESRILLLGEDLRDHVARLCCRLGGHRPRAERAAVRVELLHVDDVQPCRRQHSLGREQREVGVVLVVDRVVEVALDEP